MGNTTWNILGDNWHTILLFLAGGMAERQKVYRIFGFTVGMSPIVNLRGFKTPTFFYI